jgi:DNA polymerase elongation subunit (family B)
MQKGRYYTNVAKSGDYLLVREVRNGQRRHFKCRYQPTLYVPTRKPTDFQATDQTPVEPIKPGSMKECREFVDSYSDIENFRVYGNTGYEYAFIQEEYPGQIEYNVADLAICNLDIEVASRNGFPEPEDANEEVTAITVKNSKDGIYTVFACGVFINKFPDVKYVQCRDEIDLLCRFLGWWEEARPDILTGWNLRTFDAPYLINRITRILSDKDAKRLSPWGQIRESKVNIFNKEIQVYDIIGVSLLDYLLIYRKNVLQPRESYRLDYIAQVELGERKVDYGEYSGLQELYEKDFQKFIEYNIHDVRLVDRIDAKKRLIELQLIVAYHMKVNYVDVLSQVRAWDTLICNHLLEQHVVVPLKSESSKTQQYVGAYVMKPTPGMYEWVVSFDVTSLYPSIMRTLNMGIETKVGVEQLTPQMRAFQNSINACLLSPNDEGKPTVNIDAVMEAITPALIQHAIEQDVCIAANGQFYRRNPKSFYSVLIEALFNARIEYKNKAKAAEKERASCTDEARCRELDLLVANFDLKQSATKIQLNSLYGAMGNEYFRHFDVQNAEAVTTTGQFLIQMIARGLSVYLDKKMRTSGHRYVIYSDTDSVYLSLATVVQKYCPNGSMEETVNFVDRLCKQALQKEIERLFHLLNTRYMNGAGPYLKMAREVIGDKAIWTSKKRYLIYVRDKEGIRQPGLAPSLKSMGVEISKSTVPKFCREAMKTAVGIVMEKNQTALYKFIAETRKKYMTLPLDEASLPKSVNGLEKYADKNTIFVKGTQAHTKGALLFNHLIDVLELQSKYPKIRDGEKIKFFYMRLPNKYGVNAMGFSNTPPPELKLEHLIDWEEMWEKTFIEPLSLILNAIGWRAEQKASLNDLFGDNDDE